MKKCLFQYPYVQNQKQGMFLTHKSMPKLKTKRETKISVFLNCNNNKIKNKYIHKLHLTIRFYTLSLLLQLLQNTSSAIPYILLKKKKVDSRI